MRPRSLAWLATVAALGAVVAGTALAAASPSVQHDFTEAPTVGTQSEYAIVVLRDPPAAAYAGGIGDLRRTRPVRGQKLDPRAPEVRAYVAHLRAAQAEYRGWLASRARDAEVVRDYALAANAVAVKLNGTRAETLSQGPGVRRVTGSWVYRPAMNASVDLIRASDVWPSLGGRENAGTGIKVGIIDSGIDVSHEFFACKGEIPAKTYASGGNPPPFGLPTLVNDHGTHVAGTVAGCVVDEPIVGQISGVAPGAELYDYNVFPGFGAGFIAFGGSAFSHDICAAIEDSLADGMDVINMSLGGTVQGPHDFLAECTDAAVAAGVVAAVAAGNEGPGDGTASSPGSAPGALTAGATTNSHVIGILAEVTSAAGTAEYLAAAGDFDPFAATPATGEELANWADTGGAVTACSAAPNAAPVHGKIVLISRGDCTFTTKVRNAQNAGAFGVIVYNNVDGPPTAMGHDGTSPAPTIPAVMISRDDGVDALANLPSTAVIDGSSPQEFPAEADVLAGFSSRGPTPFTSLIKPDLTAPGVNVYSSVFDGAFASFQGTSMASPHLAGAAALLLAANSDWGPADVKSALVTTADRPATLESLSPLARGGGRANVAAAAAAPVTVDPASVSFGFWSGNGPVSASQALDVRDVGAASTCDAPVVTHAGAPGALVAVSGDAPGTLTVTLSGGRSNQTPSGDYHGDIELTCDGTTLRIPWWTRIDRKGRP
jgi:minor extracellular serine protease Vpr